MHSSPLPGGSVPAGPPGRDRGALMAAAAAALLAGAVPPLLAFNQPPSSTVLNQCLAVALWGGWVLMLSPGGLPLRGRALLAALGLVGAGALWSGLGGTLPAALMLSALGLLAAAGVLAWAGADAARRPAAPQVFAWFASGLLAAGLASVAVALVQVFAPDLADGVLVAHSGLAGRAVGNLRQPNHLCSLLLWAIIAAVALLELGRLGLRSTVAAVLLLVFAVELSASRTGALALLLLAAWGALDRRLSRRARALLLATPLLYLAAYGAMALYGHWSDQAIGAEARIATGEATGIESPNSRTRIWANALALIARQPWTGVGFGEFNYAWSLSAFPGRPTAFFDHTHTLPLQLAVELGLPLAALVMALLGLALWQAWRRSAQASGDTAIAARAAGVMVLLIGLHSLFEYPLWYAYFLLPTAFAWGFALGVPTAGTARAAPDTVGRDRLGATPGVLAGGALALGGVLAMLDYQPVVAIYAPTAAAGPLDERIARGQRSVFFAHHADYAAATHGAPLPGTELAFRRAPHYLLDTRLMTAWARHLHASGQPELARTLAERLREFRNPESAAFFAACTTPPEPASAPFQCQAPGAAHDWRAFAGR